MNHGTLLTAVISYLVIIDPIGTAIIFAGLTEGRGRSYCLKMATRSVILSTVIVLFFGFFGAELLGQLGIRIESFRIAGGIVLFYAAFNMITSPLNFPTGTDDTILEDISVFPLSFPLIAGPGCLTLTVLLFAAADGNSNEVTALVVAVVLVYLATFACLMAAGNLSRLFGQFGNSVIRRLLGVLLASLSIQFIADGIIGFVSRH